MQVNDSTYMHPQELSNRQRRPTCHILRYCPPSASTVPFFSRSTPVVPLLPNVCSRGWPYNLVQVYSLTRTGDHRDVPRICRSLGSYNPLSAEKEGAWREGRRGSCPGSESARNRQSDREKSESRAEGSGGWVEGDWEFGRLPAHPVNPKGLPSTLSLGKPTTYFSRLIVQIMALRSD